MGLRWLISGQGKWDYWKEVEVKTVAVIAGADPASEQFWKTVGRYVGQSFIRYNWEMLYCGVSTGLEGLIAKYILERNGTVTAIVEKRKHPVKMLKDLSKIIEVPDFYARKKKLHTLADAFLILPGGLGTLNDLTEIVGLHATGALKKPVVVLDPEHWFDPIVTYYKKAMKKQFIPINSLEYLFDHLTERSKIKYHITRLRR